MKGTLHRVFFTGGIALWCAFPSFSSITVRHESSDRTDSIPALLRGGVLHASVPQFFEQLGFGWQWDAASRELTCRHNGEWYVFTQDVSLYRFNDACFQLAAAPRRMGASLFLPFETLLEIINASGSGNYQWNGTSRVLTLYKRPSAVVSVACEKKHPGALVTIALTDSAPFEYSCARSRIDLTFSGVAVDTSRFRIVRPADFIDSITAQQETKSARISLLLAREVDTPQIDYLQDLHTVLVSLRPKDGASGGKRGSAAPAEAITTIVLDPGHGGKDPGATGPGGAREKDIVLPVTLCLRDMLKKKSGINIFCTRESDVFIPLAERTKMANDRGADLFISIHANATGGPRKKRATTKGYKVYFLSQAKNEEDKLAAMRENAVIELEDKPGNYNALQNVLIDLAGNEYLRESQELCILLDQQFARSFRKKIEKFQRGIGQANFWVLNGAYMPSILIEIGFISHPSEEKMLLKKSFQRELAAAIAEAVMHFKKKYETGL